MAMSIFTKLLRNLFVKPAKSFRLARIKYPIPMDDENPELKGWRRNENGTYTPISCVNRDPNAFSQERRIALSILRRLRAADNIEGMSAEYLSTLTPEDDPKVTIELVEKAKLAKANGFSRSSIGPRGGRYEMRISSKGRVYRQYY
jgi:hypothetical protein